MSRPQPPDALPLTPLQLGMLFEHLSDSAPGVDIEQIVGTLRDPVDASALESALRRVIARHEALRTTFRWEGLETPQQDVHAEATVPFRVEDWTRVPAGEREARFQEFLRADRERGFDLRVVPLLRATLVRFAADDHRFVLTFHHLLMDGRSFPQVVRELFLLHDAARDGRTAELPAPRAFREHVRWLERRDASGDEEFWTRALAGLRGPTTISTPAPAMSADSIALAMRHERTARLSRETTASLRRIAERNGFSLATTVQGALALLLARYSGEEDVVFGGVRACRRSSVPGADDIVGVFINTLPVRARANPEERLIPWLKRLREEQADVRGHELAPLAQIQRWCKLGAGVQMFEALLVYDHALLDTQVHDGSSTGARGLRRFEMLEQTGYPLTFYVYGEAEMYVKFAWDARRLRADDATRFLAHFATLLESMAEDPERTLGDLPMLGAEEKRALLFDFNDTRRDYPRDVTIADLFEAQVARTPDATALVCSDVKLTYRELEQRADELAARLHALGVAPEVLVGLCLERSIEMVVAVLAVHKAGGAYLPLDPAYPKDRLDFIFADSGARVLLTTSALAATVAAGDASVVKFDELESTTRSGAKTRRAIGPASLAYVLYTSGSTGKPKGVMVEHRNAVNFFVGMDERLGRERGTWLAVTSLSFDISVLEILWTLTRGFEVVVYTGRETAKTTSKTASNDVGFSLFYFASDEGENASDKYRLLLDGARFADERGFEAVWTPERHFHAFGGLYPNPSVAAAALSTITRRIQIRAGSVVLPLHDPVRITEEWSLVDNLSNGRVGISFASGWQPRDFVLAPENYANRKDVMTTGIETVRHLWRGGSIERRAPDGSMQTITTLPRPVQKDLPVWVTTAGNIDTWRSAGELGANVLTHLLGQRIEELTTKVAAYREARTKAGHAGPGRVTIMLHTLVGRTDDEVRDLVRQPMIAYLKSSVGLIKDVIASFPTFKKGGAGAQEQADFSALSAEEMDALLEHAFERYFETSGLFGTVETCLRQVERVRSTGVDEFACLIDFGVPSTTVLAHLELLDEVRRRASAPTSGSTVASLLARHHATHLQCTPSMATMILAEEGAEEALRGLRLLMIGGEAFPGPLARKLSAIVSGRVVNMYGPTETTVWSSTHDAIGDDAVVPIGKPIANTQFFVLDARGSLAPIGLAGELFIGGDSVARGYLKRPELTAERFVASPFAAELGARLYRTGDQARWRTDGVLEFLGRGDQQVKLRGYRIELGEIDAALGEEPGVREVVCVVREDRPDEKRLVAYVVAAPGTKLDPRALRAGISSKLPDFMLPSHYVQLDVLPKTPNAKIDRKALPAPEAAGPAERAAPVAPEGELEAVIAGIWREVLAIPAVGREDNFFELGGHSLLTVQVQGRLRRQLGRQVPITDLFRFPTVRTLARFLDGAGAAGEAAAAEQTEQRVKARTEGRDRASSLRDRRSQLRGQG